MLVYRFFNSGTLILKTYVHEHYTFNELFALNSDPLNFLDISYRLKEIKESILFLSTVPHYSERLL